MSKNVPGGKGFLTEDVRCRQCGQPIILGIMNPGAVAEGKDKLMGWIHVESDHAEESDHKATL